jgi:dCTP deaminase
VILSDREIQAAVKRDAIRITPAPAVDAWSSTAVDLTLAPTLRRWIIPAGGAQMSFAPHHPEFNFQALTDQLAEEIAIPPEGFLLQQHAFVLGWTVEKIGLPHASRLAARVEGKSSLARLGLGVHVTAPTIHAGFGYNENDPAHPGNALQLEIWHVGPLPILLVPGMPVCQLIFEEVHGTPEKGYAGMFANQGA